MKNGCGHQERDRSTALMRASTSISANRYAHGIINPDSLTRRSSPPFDLGCRLEIEVRQVCFSRELSRSLLSLRLSCR
jgi:hypothetical protein